jgi:hypothetical protein
MSSARDKKCDLDPHDNVEERGLSHIETAKGWNLKYESFEDHRLCRNHGYYGSFMFVLFRSYRESACTYATG